jgi:hypothetical protein
MTFSGASMAIPPDPKQVGPVLFSIARRSFILRPALRDYGGQVVHSDISTQCKDFDLVGIFESRMENRSSSFLTLPSRSPGFQKFHNGCILLTVIDDS